MTILFFLLGLAFLIVGAEALVRGASRLATSVGISPLIIGLTIVAFGTSSPELAVSIKSALAGQADIALGNVVGSNIFNVLFILGLSALIVPLIVSQQLIRLDVPLMIGLSGAILLLSMDRLISRTDGAFLMAGLIAYVAFLLYQGRRSAGPPSEPEPGNTDTSGWAINIVLVAAGLATLVLGSRWLVDSAVTFAQLLGVSELIIGLTIVAAGTSMPEVVTSIIAAIRGERDIAVGNVVGSNIFNIMGVLGIAGVVAPSGIEVTEVVINFDLPIMIAVAFACLPVFFTGGVISRWEGALFMGYYQVYTLYLILAAAQHDALPAFSGAMLYFVIPLTAITLLVIVLKELRVNKARHS